MASQFILWMMFTTVQCILFASVHAVNVANSTQKHIPVDVFCKNNPGILCTMMYMYGACCTSFRVRGFTITLSATESGNTSSRLTSSHGGIVPDTLKTIGIEDQVDCNTLPQLPDMNGSATTTSYGAVANYRCKSGYSGIGSGESICQVGGLWSKPVLTCTAIDCGQPITPNGTSTLTVGGNTTYNATGKVICDILFTLSSGDNIIRCLETGKWSEARCSLCNDSLTNRLPISSFTASSQYNAYQGPDRARLNTQEELPKRGAWVAKKRQKNEWLQVDLLRHAQVKTVTTQGRACARCAHWVTKYTVEYSVDEMTWTQLTDENDAVQTFDGNTDQDTPVTNWLGKRITARYVRIKPQEWKEWVALRMDVNGC